jgi:glucokinase
MVPGKPCFPIQGKKSSTLSPFPVRIGFFVCIIQGELEQVVKRLIGQSLVGKVCGQMETETKLALGVDIGGTKVAVGLVDAAGGIRAQSRTAMVSVGEPGKGLEAVSEAIEALFGKWGSRPNIDEIGICAPGPLNPITGVIINPPNLPIWHNYSLAGEMRKRYGLEIRIDNDANAAALAEAKWGAGRGYRNIFYATIGTGIGTGIVFDGKIYHGKTGAAGEGGHAGIDMHGPRCNCGKRGCIETLAAGPGIARRALQKLAAFPNSLMKEMANGKGDEVTSHIVAKAYAKGDPAAAEVLAETLDMLAYWLGNIIDLLEPDVIVVGGGVSLMLTPFLHEIRERWKGACLNPAPLSIPLVQARYGEDAGIAGAAALCGID